MEKKLNQKIDTFITNFKTELIEKILQKDDDIIDFIKSYKSLIFDKNDLSKRKRMKASVPYYDRCNALRSCGNQCTRRKKKDEMFCGTHLKGVPNGTIQKKPNEKNITKIEITPHDIRGIIYFMDNDGNIYCPNDILQNKPIPNIISKYTIDSDGKYIIQDF